MTHSDVVMTCGIGDESCVLNSHVDGGSERHTSTGRLLGVHQGYKVAVGSRGGWQ